MKTIFLFPGQGSQYPGMGKDFHDTSESCRALFDLASDTAKVDLRKVVFESTEEELKRTINTQLSIALVSRMVSLALAERGVNAAGAAGFSLGEWPALREAGVIDDVQLFSLLKIRAELMDKAVEKLGGGCGMSAILALAQDDVTRVIRESGIPDVWPANYNAPTQVVISGRESSLEKAEELLKAAGARKTVRLKVSGPFHSPLIAYARDGMKEALADAAFKDPAIPLYSNVTGKRILSGAEAKANAAEQIVSPVRWTDEEALIAGDGYERALETGPGAVLQGLWKSAGSIIPCLPAGQLAQLEAVS